MIKCQSTNIDNTLNLFDDATSLVSVPMRNNMYLLEEVFASVELSDMKYRTVHTSNYHQHNKYPHWSTAMHDNKITGLTGKVW